MIRQRNLLAVVLILSLMSMVVNVIDGDLHNAFAWLIVFGITLDDYALRNWLECIKNNRSKDESK